MLKMTAEGVIRGECFSLPSEFVDGRVVCSAYVSFDELNPEDVCSDKFEGIEMRFALAEVVNDVLLGHRSHDGSIDPEGRVLLAAIRAELEEMIRRIDGTERCANPPTIPSDLR